ncbi:uncharacterized protein TNCT_28751 [Trichonephila clavata]|uniref:Protein kinase domain-containing protein n=1 Tax=Trichonephila clavata TaxID=2740835 RepID=A0A8X6M6H4_TRICU|nr:uncharacterized protein TNCT_28751 [Trichonephila clavata]
MKLVERHDISGDLVTRVLKKVLRCNCPAQKGQRSRKFVRLLTHFLKTVKIYTGWNCRKQRIFLRVVASSLDSFVDYLKELKNPFYFYSMDDELKARLHNILQACRIHRPIPYVIMLSPWKIVKINKIAEGSYGEIYSVKNADGPERILKIIGVYGSPRDDPSRTLDFEDAVGDVICTK